MQFLKTPSGRLATPAAFFRSSVGPLAVVAGLGAGVLRLSAAPPRYDHVVVVMEENRTSGQIIGDLVNAPYLTSLARGGVSLTSMFALIHPSQPNYLELFSGANQGVVDDNLPPTFSTTATGSYPFRTANLGAELLAAGFSFAGYSEQLESAGTVDWADYDPHSATHPGIYYRRKHNPWANWVAKALPAAANQLPGSVNRAFTQFPADFRQLPTVSFVIPNQLHDMHDGSRKEADDWLRDNLGAYAAWARTNNSLLVVTWDEDDYNEDNQIPTLLFGAGLRDGTEVRGVWTLHNLLRTFEDMYGTTTHAGAAALVRPLVGPFVTDPSVGVATFRQGLNGYSGTRDTQIWQETPDTSFALVQNLNVDLDTTSAVAGNQPAQALIRFENLFGPGPGQVPPSAVIHSAKLLLHTPKNTTGTDYDSNDSFRLHRLMADWNDTATWNSLGGGVSTDDVEAAAVASFSAVPDVDGGPAIFDVTDDVERFRTGTANRGWVIRPSTAGTGDGWTWNSSEFSPDPDLRPRLEVVYSLSGLSFATWSLARGLAAPNNDPEADPDQDGANNLAEFAYNLNPLVADATPVTAFGTNGVPAVRRIAVPSGDLLQIQYIRRKAGTTTGLAYSTEFSSDLGSWTTNQTLTVASINADWERVTARSILSGFRSSQFGRVVLSLQP